MKPIQQISVRYYNGSMDIMQPLAFISFDLISYLHKIKSRSMEKETNVKNKRQKEKIQNVDSKDNKYINKNKVCLVWHGLYIIRHGMYKNGKFKFKVTFDTFPRRPPKIYFMSQVMHPLIDLDTGLLLYPKQLIDGWQYPDCHLIYTTIQYMRTVFLQPTYFVLPQLFSQGFSKQKQDTLERSPQYWYIRAKQSVFNSISQLYTNYEETSFRFVKYDQNNKKHETIKLQLQRLMGYKEIKNCSESEDDIVVNHKISDFQEKKLELAKVIQQACFQESKDVASN